MDSKAGIQAGISYLDQENAKKVDEELMNELGFSIDLLMELAGLSVAQSIYDANKTFHAGSLKNILLICGPGNNGGDGFVAARHLKMLGFKPTLYTVKSPDKALFINLVKTCHNNEIPSFNHEILIKELEEKKISLDDYFENTYDLIVDAIFGFSFKGPIRQPYDNILSSLARLKKTPVFSVDIPSGWDVEKGPLGESSLDPKYLISLTLPKLGVKNFKGKHYLGGRFIPKKMIDKYGWVVPDYSGLNQYQLL